MTVSRVNIKGDSDLDPNNDQDYAKLKKLIVNDGTQQTVTRRYVGQPDYKVLQDSMTIEGLPVGVYLVEFSTERANMRTERVLLHVSDLYVMHESLPDNRIRLVAVNATTGRPVPGAQIRLTTNTYNRNNGKQVNTLTTDGRDAPTKSTSIQIRMTPAPSSGLAVDSRSTTTKQHRTSTTC